MKPTLVILAAGMGSRYGGLKQLEPVGPGGATLMDYTVFDAARYGFGKVVFIIRREMEAEFDTRLGRRFAKRLPVEYAFQRTDTLPPEFDARGDRTKPWGTGHAVLCAEPVIDGPFAVVNADDYYGTLAMERVAGFLTSDQAGATPAHALAGYTLRDTLSDAGSVNRAVCTIDSGGYLEDIVEIVNIERRGSGGRYVNADDTERLIDGDAVVSMNFWAFARSIFHELRSGFEAFLRTAGSGDKAEFYIADAVRAAIRSGRARLRVLPGHTGWCGVTHRADVPRVRSVIGELIADGTYPSELWA